MQKLLGELAVTPHPAATFGQPLTDEQAVRVLVNSVPVPLYFMRDRVRVVRHLHCTDGSYKFWYTVGDDRVREQWVMDLVARQALEQEARRQRFKRPAPSVGERGA